MPSKDVKKRERSRIPDDRTVRDLDTAFETSLDELPGFSRIVTICILSP